MMILRTEQKLIERKDLIHLITIFKTFFMTDSHCSVHYDLLFQKFSKFQKWYQKLPSYVCRNTQKFYQTEACTLGDIAIFVSRVGRGKSGNLTHFTTKMSTFFEFSREKSNLRGFAAAMTYIFIN